MTETEALEKIRNYILNRDHKDGIIAPILNWCDEALESPKTMEANMKKRNRDLGTAEKRMYRYNLLRGEINERYERFGEIPSSFAFPTAFEWEDRPYEEGDAK